MAKDLALAAPKAKRYGRRQRCVSASCDLVHEIVAVEGEPPESIGWRIAQIEVDHVGLGQVPEIGIIVEGRIATIERQTRRCLAQDQRDYRGLRATDARRNVRVARNDEVEQTRRFAEGALRTRKRRSARHRGIATRRREGGGTFVQHQLSRVRRPYSNRRQWMGALAFRLTARSMWLIICVDFPDKGKLGERHLMSNKPAQTGADEERLVQDAGSAAQFVLSQLGSSIGYYMRAASTAKRAALGYVAVSRTCYVISGVIIAVTVVGAWEYLLSLLPQQVASWTAVLGLPLSTPKWTAGVLGVGYLLSQYAQRRGFSRAWTRYAQAEQDIRALRRRFIVQISISHVGEARDQACLALVEELNSILAEETRNWARDVMSDLDRVHALLQEGGPNTQSRRGSAGTKELQAG